MIWAASNNTMQFLLLDGVIFVSPTRYLFSQYWVSEEKSHKLWNLEVQSEQIHLQACNNLIWGGPNISIATNVFLDIKQ